MENKILYAEDISTIAYNEQEKNEKIDHDKYRVRVTQLNADALDGYDQYFGIVDSVTYNDKTDKYIIKHQFGTAKCTDAVAQYLMQHGFNRRMRPTVNAQMIKGTVEAVVLRYIGAKEN